MSVDRRELLANAEAAIDAGLNLAARLRFYTTFSCTLVWAIIIAAYSGRITWTFVGWTFATALLCGFVSRGEECLRQRKALGRLGDSE